MGQTASDLVQLALQAREYAYCPYSKFHVGAALKSAQGFIYTGSNVENATYGATCCAERVALFKAVSEGVRDFTELAVASDADTVTLPCGICLQVLCEFAPDLTVYTADRRGAYKTFNIQELLPHRFKLDDHKAPE